MNGPSLLHPQVDADLTTIEDLIDTRQYRPNIDDPSLGPLNKINDVWPEQPRDDHLHVFVTSRLVPGVMGSSTLIQGRGSASYVSLRQLSISDEHAA
jgi:hypothetical protein